MNLADGASHWELLLFIPMLAMAGALTGLLAGLFGVGGGAITVPVLYQTLRIAGVPDKVALPLSIGTSLAVIIPTSISSTRAHLAKGAVDLDLIKRWIVPVFLGVSLGAWIASFAPAGVFKIVFVCIATFSAVRMLGGLTHFRIAESMPVGPLEWLFGSVIGLLSSLMGIGGAQLVNLVLSLYGVTIHRAIATSAGIGLIISVPGTIGYMIAGWGKADLPPGSIGFVSLIAFALIAPVSTYVAPFGARLAHSWPRRKLEISFGLFMVAVSARFLVSLIFGV